MIHQGMSYDEQKHILEAAEAHIRNHSAIIYQTHSSRGMGIGSAVCINIGGRLFLATAAHNFELVENGGEVAFFAGQKSMHTPLPSITHNYSQYGKKGTLDLAWIELEPAPAARANLQGLPLSSLDSFHTAEKTVCYTIAGFPWERVKFYKNDSGDLKLSCEAVMYITIPLPPKSGDEGLFFDYPDDAISFDGPPVPYPGGFSGGGIWATPAKDTSLVYVPTFHVVGITVEYYKDAPRRIRALPIYKWLEFFLTDHPELREHIEPLLIPKTRNP